MASSLDKNKKVPLKDKKLIPLSKPVYTTRQIMELEERRRKEVALAEQAAAVSNPQPVDVPTLNIENRLPEVVEENNTPLPNGKAVAQWFREEPVGPKEKEISSLIEQQWDQALEQIKPEQIQVQVQEEKVAVSVDENVQRLTDVAPAEKPKQKERLNQNDFFKTFAGTDWLGLAFSLSAGIVFFLMFSYLFSIGFNPEEYAQGPLTLMIALSIAWLNRNRLELRREWFWGATSILVGGLCIFALALSQGSSYLALTGFMFTAFGLFLWRYTEESAYRLIFPIAYLVFMFSPPDHWAQVFVPVLNSITVQGAYFLVASFHIPSSVQGQIFNIDGYRLLMDGDLTAFRSLVAFSGVGALYAYFQRTMLIGKAIILFAVLPLVILANIIRIALAGWIATNYGLEYGQIFLNDYSVIGIFVLTISGLFISSFLLKNEEEL